MAENSVSDTETLDDCTYSIYRFYAPHLRRERELIETGLTLEEAQAHCNREDTREAGQWFDGYVKE